MARASERTSVRRRRNQHRRDPRRTQFSGNGLLVARRAHPLEPTREVGVPELTREASHCVDNINPIEGQTPFAREASTSVDMLVDLIGQPDEQHVAHQWRLLAQMRAKFLDRSGTPRKGTVRLNQLLRVRSDRRADHDTTPITAIAPPEVPLLIRGVQQGSLHEINATVDGRDAGSCTDEVRDEGLTRRSILTAEELAREFIGSANSREVGGVPRQLQQLLVELQVRLREIPTKHSRIRYVEITATRKFLNPR